MWKKVGIGLIAFFALAAAVVIRPDRSITEVEDEYKTPISKFAMLKDGTRMHYWETGNADGPTLLLLHGSYDSADTWEDWLPLLENDFHIVAPDLPGHGLTGKTIANDYKMPAMVVAVHELVEQLGLERFHVAGNSMGANVGWRYTLAHPKRVDRLVLIDSVGYPGLGSLTVKDPNAVVRFFFRYGNPTLMVRSGFEKAVADPSVITDERAERSVAFTLREEARAVHLQRTEEYAVNAQPFQQIPKIEQPTLVLWGELDALIPVAHSKRFDADLPNGELIVYSGIGHMPQLEIPKRSSDDMRRFLLAPTKAEPKTEPNAEPNTEPEGVAAPAIVPPTPAAAPDMAPAD